MIVRKANDTHTIVYPKFLNNFCMIFNYNVYIDKLYWNI